VTFAIEGHDLVIVSVMCAVCGVLIRLYDRMRWVYHRCQDQRGTRPAHQELRGEIPVIIKKRTIHSTVTKVRNQERGA
jgi:hypothetical protein